MDRNSPGNLEDLYKVNDVELFDLDNDRAETVNLAADRGKNADLIATMSNKLETLIKADVGKITWTIDRADL